MCKARLTASRLIRLVCFLSLLLCASLSIRAELLPVKTYTTADGLLRDTAYCIVQDSRGFLWFCTSDGLSRFDGYGFTNYTTDDGLPHRIVNAFLETRNGVYWVGTNDGLARFDPRGARGSLFVNHHPENNERSNVIEVLFEDRHQKLWVGTGDGLYWLEERDGKVNFNRVELPKAKTNLASVVLAITADQSGNLWIGTDGQGLFRILPGGGIERYTDKNGLPMIHLTSLLEDQNGKIWVGMSGDGGTCQLISEPDPKHAVISRCYTKRDGLSGNWIRRISQSSDGKVWFSAPSGLTIFDQKAVNESQFRIYKEAEGLCDGESWAAREDRDGNIWVSTSCGVKKITRSGFVRFTQADGLASLFVNGIFISHAGALLAITKQAVETNGKQSRVAHSINRFDKNRFTFATPRLPEGVGTSWGAGQIVVQDQAGDWWLPGDKQAVYRFPRTDDVLRLANVKPQIISISEQEVFRIYEDSRGDLWISTTQGGAPLKWERITGAIREYKNEIVGPGMATCFAEDSAGNLWMGFDYGEAKLTRYRDGRFSVISNDETKASGGISFLYFDRAGRLWFTSRVKGVARIDKPNAEGLDIVWYNRKKGLATDGTSWLVEDKFGRIYVGHGRGVDRIDPATEHIKHYTTADGLPQGAIQFAAQDGQGALWFGSYGGGLARLIPEQDKPRQVPNILLTGLRVAGVAQPVSGLGDTNLPDLSLNSNQTHMSVDFLGLGASLGEELKYQYQLEGASDNWIETTQRTVDFANLSAGSYRFQVRAVTFDGLVSQTPATISFTIARPIWQRWWFLLIVATALTLILVTLYRYRVRRLLELERIRTRIASDLHDDIGASLSRIAIMSEVVKRQVTGSNGESGRLLTDIADSARELTGSMRDIVWAIDPRRDDLGSVVSRIRQFASDVLEAKGIKWDFHTPAELDKIQLGPDQRRHILLFFKEAINNIARHSDCTTARLSIDVQHGKLIGEVRDNGQGLKLSSESQVATELGGHGLESMKRRVTQLGGTFSIDSAPGEGTHLKITILVRKP